MSEVQDFIERQWENIASEIEFTGILDECKALSRPYMNVFADYDVDQINERRWRRLPNSQRIRQPVDRHAFTNDWQL